MPPWLLTQILSAVITSVAGLIVGIVSQKLRSTQHREEVAREMSDAMREGMIVLLRQKLIDIHEKWVIEQGYVPIEVKRQADDIYGAYHTLGGNGTGTELRRVILAAHTTPWPTVSQQESEITS